MDGGGTVDISCTLENDGSVSTQETVVTTPTPMPTATPAPGVSVTPGTPTATTAPQKDSDINDDGYVDGADVAAVVASYSTAQGDAEYNPKADFCGPTAAGSDGRINAYEVSCLIRDWNPRR